MSVKATLSQTVAVGRLSVLGAGLMLAVSGLLVFGYQAFLFLQSASWFRIPVINAVRSIASSVQIAPSATLPEGWAIITESLSQLPYAPTAFVVGGVISLYARRHV
jgi:hypothetical protein